MGGTPICVPSGSERAARALVHIVRASFYRNVALAGRAGRLAQRTDTNPKNRAPRRNAVPMSFR